MQRGGTHAARRGFKMRWKALALVLLAVVATAGCKGTGGGRADEFGAMTAQDQIAARFGTFIDCVMSEDYEGIRPLVLASQATGFDPKAFVEDRLRMTVGSFQVVVWDKRFIGVTPVKGKPYCLSTAAANARIYSTNEVKRVYVNLYWQKQGGEWYIVPFAGS
jgi:hypothetical protein